MIGKRSSVRLAALLSAVLGMGFHARAVQLDLAALGTATQSGEAPAPRAAALAVDGNAATFSETANATNSWWEVELERPYRLTRLELTAPALAAYSNVTGGLVLRVQDLRDRTVYQAAVADPGLGGTWAVDLPAGVDGRIIRVGLENSLPNGAGDFRVALAEVRAYGDPSPAYGPLAVAAIGTAAQSSDYSASYPAANAIDGNPATFSHTADLSGSYWILTLDRARPIRRIELVNRPDSNAARMQGLTLRILDAQSNSVASATVANPGLGGVWGYDAPAGTTGRYVRVGLEGGATNGNGDYVVALAEVSVLTATNLALNRESYMVRYLDSLAPASNANDGNYTTESKTTNRSVDGYWEVDLGAEQALYTVRAVSTTVDPTFDRLSHATLRLFDGAHESVYAQHLAGSTATYDLDLGGPVRARYVRIGFENKERSSPDGAIEWYLGLKEVQAFGRPLDEVGIPSFRASVTQLVAGASTILMWQVRDLQRLDLYPGIGSVGAQTGLNNSGALQVSPTGSVEYLLVGTNACGAFTRAVTIVVDGQALPARISEFVADNRLTLRDGRKESPDWIELHNPNNTALALAGYGLSDDPADPMKWIFPAVSIPPHGYLVVFASGRDEPYDDEGFLHAAFQLDADGESVVLTAPDGVTTVDAAPAYPAQREDLAYGRTLNGAWTFLEPTPGAPNLAAAYEGWLHPLVFSHERGFYTNAFALAISNTNAGASVFYTLGGTAPATPYAGPMTLATTACVRASVTRPGYKAPRVPTHTYIFLDDVIASPVMNTTITQDPRYSDRLRKGMTDLPTVCISVPVLPDDYIEREASVEIFLPDGAEPLQQNCGFYRFGGAWTTFAKKNYRIKFRPEYGARKLETPLLRGFDHGFLAQESFDELDLRGGGHDMVQRGFYMSARFTEDTMLDMGSLNPHGRFVHLYVNGTYWGQYHTRERLKDGFLADYLGGATEDYVTVRGNDNVGDNFIPGTPDPPNRYPWERVRALRGSYQSVKPYLDVSHLIDFMLVWFYGSCETEYRAAGPLDAGSGFKFWIGDPDGFLPSASWLSTMRTLTLDRTTNVGPGGLFGALAAEGDPDFKTLLADRIYRHFFNGGAMTPARNTARLDERMDEIVDSLIAECARWGYRTPDNWEGAAETIRTGLFPARTANLFTYLKNRGFYPSIDPPLFSQHGGSVTNGSTVTLTAGSGTIYYTLDGSDPRLPGGGIAPGALAWTPGSEATLFPLGSTWRYWDQGSLPATNWTALAFQDGAWPAGPAELGYGDGGEATVISYGPSSANKYRAYYFRHAFTVADTSAVGRLLVDLVRDDGAVVYLNGHEILRHNMPVGEIDYGTWASSTVGGSDESRVFNFDLSPEHLVPGTNVVAVEVHQIVANSSDISFNLALRTQQTASDLQLTLTNNTVVCARLYDGATWSALTEARFLMADRRSPADGDLLFSEINYNPDGSDDYEFLELYNASSNLVDLTGARMADGVDFLFPDGFCIAPGACAVLVEDDDAFAARYRTPSSPWYYPDILVAGEWAGRLDDNGERLALASSNGVEVAVARYEAGGSWPQRADGRGSSLELRNPAEVPADAAARAVYLAQGRRWKSSALYHGSPGRLDTGLREVVINEVLAHTDLETDWVELHNPGTAAVDLSGLYLGDHYDQPFRYQVPEDTVLEPGGFLKVGAAELGFGFSELGSDCLLTEASGTNLLRFVDTVDFPAVEREEPFGRYMRSDGLVDFTELRATSPATTNALPRVGPVVFSEIMYHPAAGYAEFVELLNISGAAVPLYDPAIPSNTWELSGAVDFAFPAGQQLAPGAAAIVCATNPSVFRTQYGVDGAVPVYGPWDGALNNAGESVKLRRPGNPEPDGSVPYYRVDRVLYEPVAPWPEGADVGGFSLERMPLEAYGNDPASWQASDPGGSPGGYSGNRAPLLSVAGTNTAAEGTAVELAASWADPDEPWQTVALRAENLPPGSAFDPPSGIFSWATGEIDGPGVYAVRFIAADDAFAPGASTQTVTVTIQEINAPPVLQPHDDLRYPALIPLNLDLSASDPDLPAQALQFAADGLPVGLTLDPVSGLISGRTTAPGQYPVVVSVRDDQVPPLAATNGFTLTIAEPFCLRAVDDPPDPVPGFTFQAMAGETYEIDYSDALDPADWHFLERVEDAPEGPVAIPPGPEPIPAQRYFRVRWLP